jgi:hypothetical protein
MATSDKIGVDNLELLLGVALIILGALTVAKTLLD